MPKDKDKVDLRPVDETEKVEPRLIRLHKDAVEEVEDRLSIDPNAEIAPGARLEAAGKMELKKRSNEPDVTTLIEREVEIEERLWDSSKETRGLPWGWLALVGCAFAAGITWSLIEVGRSDYRRNELLDEAKIIIEKEKEEDMEAETTISSIEALAENFFISRSVDEMLRYVRHPERVRPFLENYYAEAGPVPARVERVNSLDPLTIGNHATFWMVMCDLDSGKTGQMLVEVPSPEIAKVDWETYVCYQPMDWDKFAIERPAGYGGDFRVFVERDSFYSHEFSDSNRFESFRLTTINGVEILNGYVERYSPLAQRLAELISDQEGKAVPAILTLSIPVNARSRRGVLIEKLVSAGWMFVKSPEVEP